MRRPRDAADLAGADSDMDGRVCLLVGLDRAAEGVEEGAAMATTGDNDAC